MNKKSKSDLSDAQIRKILGEIDIVLEKTTDRGAIFYRFMQAVSDVEEGNATAHWPIILSGDLYDILRPLAECWQALGEIYNQGYNDDCIFCGLKDKIAMKVKGKR